MSDYLNISDFLLPVNIHELNFDEGYKDGQLGKLINVYNEYEEFPDIDDAQIVLVGCGEQRGSGLVHGQSKAPDVIRRHLYSLFYWHQDVKVADIGNIKAGSLYTDGSSSVNLVWKFLRGFLTVFFAIVEC